MADNDGTNHRLRDAATANEVGGFPMATCELDNVLHTPTRGQPGRNRLKRWTALQARNVNALGVDTDAVEAMKSLTRMPTTLINARRWEY